MNVEKISFGWQEAKRMHGGTYWTISWTALAEMITGQRQPFRLRDDETIDGFKISVSGLRIRLRQGPEITVYHKG